MLLESKAAAFASESGAVGLLSLESMESKDSKESKGSKESKESNAEPGGKGAAPPGGLPTRVWRVVDAPPPMLRAPPGANGAAEAEKSRAAALAAAAAAGVKVEAFEMCTAEPGPRNCLVGTDGEDSSAAKGGGSRGKPSKKL